MQNTVNYIYLKNAPNVNANPTKPTIVEYNILGYISNKTIITTKQNMKRKV